MNRASRLTALVFFAAGIVLRLPFRSQYLYHWDSVNFALGLTKYDILVHQPQPPGYILYILLGRLFKLVFASDNASLVWISILFSGLAAAALYWLAARMFDEPVGISAGLLGLTSPLVWFYSEVALSYTVEAFFVCVVALCCYRVLTGTQQALIPGAILFGLAGGFRQNTLILLLPLWLFSLKAVGWRKRAEAVLVLGAVVVSWLAVMVWMSGGVEPFMRAMLSQTGSNLGDSAAGSLQSLALNLVRLALFTLYAVTLLVVVLPVSLVWAARSWKRLLRDPRWQVLGLWLLPPLAFYALYVQQGGHTFTYLPALLILLAFTLVKVIAPYLRGRIRWGRVATGLTGAAVAVNLFFFLTAQPYLFGIQKFILRTPSVHAIQDRDETLAQKISAIRSQFAPEQTIVLAGGMDFRIPAYYLADYRFPFLSYDPAGLTEAQIREAGKVEYLVLFNADASVDSMPLASFNRAETGSGEAVYWIKLGDNARLTFSKQGVGVKWEGAP